MADFNWDDAKSGAATGAIGGATVGTAVMPGIGTAVGAGAGAIGGGLIGGFGGFGGGLWDTLSGQAKSNDTRYGGTKETQALMKQNEAQLGNWAYTGNGPSASQALLERNRSEGQQRAASNANALAGGNAALAAQMADRQGAQVSADSAYNAAQVRSLEQQNAMAAYQKALETRRQQNIEIAKNQSDLDQKNAENNADFIGSLLSGGGSALGGMLG